MTLKGDLNYLHFKPGKTINLKTYNNLKSDMVYHDYSWSVYHDDNPKITGVPDNGYEVLYFINKMADFHRLKDKKEGEKIEMMLRELVPPNLGGQLEINEWIENSFPITKGFIFIWNLFISERNLFGLILHGKAETPIINLPGDNRITVTN